LKSIKYLKVVLIVCKIRTFSSLAHLFQLFLWTSGLTISFLRVRFIKSSRLAHTADSTYLHQFSRSVILQSSGTIHARLYRLAHTLFRVHIQLKSVPYLVIDTMQLCTSDYLLQGIQSPWINERFYEGRNFISFL
jgi:hypothetical protein